MNPIDKKRQFLKDLITGKKKLKDYNLETLEQKVTCFNDVTTEELKYLIFFYRKYQIKDTKDINEQSIEPEKWQEYLKISKKIIYK